MSNNTPERKSLWFPEKGQERLRPELVRGSLKIRRGMTGGFFMEWRFRYRRKYLRAWGEGDTPDAAREAAEMLGDAMIVARDTALDRPVSDDNGADGS